MKGGRGEEEGREREGEKCEGGEESACLVTRSVSSGGNSARVTSLVGFFRYRRNSDRESMSG